MKRNLWLFLIVLSISIIITYPAFPPSHSLGSYCTMCKGYVNTGIWFLQNGRVFSYLFLMLAKILNISFNALGFLSVLLGNCFISLAIVVLYKELSGKVRIKNYYYNYLLLGLVFLIYYNPLYTSVLVFDEVAVMDLGILLLTLAVIRLFRGGGKNYFISLLLTILGVMCYQGVASYLFVVLFILFISDKDRIDDIKFYLSRFLLNVFNYGVSFGISLIIINIVNNLLNKSNDKIGNFNIFDNFVNIIRELIPSSFKNLFNYVNVKFYYLLVLISIVIFIVFLVKNSNKVKNIILVVLLIVSCLLVPFIPNLFMASSTNYTDARMSLTLGIVPVVLLLFIILSFNVEKKSFIVVSFFGFSIFLLTFYSIRQNMLIDLKRYSNDMNYLNMVISEVGKYEEESGIIVDTIYYHNDIDSAYYYKYGHANGMNIRVMAVPWAFECAFNAITDNKFVFKEMDDDKYNELFLGRNYDEFNDEQLVYEDNNLYLLIY